MDPEELGYRFPALSVILTLLLPFYCIVDCLQVIGSPRPIIAALGDDVVLPCQVEPPFNALELTVEWSRHDLSPDPQDRLSRVGYVHLYRDAREVPDMKIPSYATRTALFTDSLTQGNLSLRIRNVTLADEGGYICLVPEFKGPNKSSVVHLVIEPMSTKSGTTGTQPPYPLNVSPPDPTEEMDVKVVLSGLGMLITLLIALMIMAGGVLFHKDKRKKRSLMQMRGAATLPDHKQL